MNGQLVVVKDVTNKLLLRKVCYAAGRLVYVASEEAFQLIEKGETALFPIGFPRECVFVHDGRDLTKPMNWQKMKRWRD